MIVNNKKGGCAHCFKCKNVCRFDAINVINGDFVTDELNCEGCSNCLYVCPTRTISMPDALSGSSFIARNQFCHGGNRWKCRPKATKVLEHAGVRIVKSAGKTTIKEAYNQMIKNWYPFIKMVMTVLLLQLLTLSRSTNNNICYGICIIKTKYVTLRNVKQ